MPIKFMIINRSFWPSYPVIGEALLQLAERAVARGHAVFLITQGQEDLKVQLSRKKRGKGCVFFQGAKFSNQSNRLLFRAFDSFVFLLTVIFRLVQTRPDKIYVSTDPPVLIPFFVMVYCKLFRAKFIYHLQDIHPEATNAITQLNSSVFNILVWMDTQAMLAASSLITISEQMLEEIQKRTKTDVCVYRINNPAASFSHTNAKKSKTAGFSFCGNAGRMQRIPMLLEAIQTYYDNGGKLPFVFAGSGVHTKSLIKMNINYPLFDYLGMVDAEEAARVTAKYDWGLLPIEDAVTQYSFPSKTSTYLMSGVQVLAICGKNTSVAKWVFQNKIGKVITPSVEKVVEAFFDIENNREIKSKRNVQHVNSGDNLSISNFVNTIYHIVFEKST
jgi:glycosyltransferase involved in cell wall biosynthesis